jgi:hypothetical protein
VTNREGQEIWTVMQDPEGNEFCVIGRETPASRAWPTSLREPEPEALGGG